MNECPVCQIRQRNKSVREMREYIAKNKLEIARLEKLNRFGSPKIGAVNNLRKRIAYWEDALSKRGDSIQIEYKNTPIDECACTCWDARVEREWAGYRDDSNKVFWPCIVGGSSTERINNPFLNPRYKVVKGKLTIENDKGGWDV